MKKTLISLVLILGILVWLTAQTNQPVSKAALDRGKAVYESTCLACHQANGGGVPNLNPPLSKTKYVLGDQSKLINIVLKGLNEEIDIDGDIYNNPMPSFAHLSDQEIANVLTYVRNSFGNKVPAITIAQVKAERAKVK